MPFGGLLTAGLVSGGASLIGSIFGASATEKAAQEQTQEEQQALQFQEQEYSTQQANEAPYLSAGKSSLSQLMAAISSGQYGPGSVAPFTAPTAAQAAATPGYQFTQNQGEQGIERGAAAAGGAFTGGTLKSLATYDTGLADNTYQQTYGNALSTYQTNLAAQNQSFNQLSSIAGLGENAAANAGNTGAQAASTIGSTLNSIGSTAASGTLGVANSLTGGLNGAASAATTPFYLNYLAQNQVGQIPQATPAAASGFGLTSPSTFTNTAAPNYTIDPADFAGLG